MGGIRWFARLIRQLVRGVSDGGPRLEHPCLKAASGLQIADWRTLRWHRRQGRQKQPDQLLHLGVGFLRDDQHLFLFHDPDPDQLCLRCRELGISRRAGRLLSLAPQVPQVGNSALVEREAVTLPLDHANGFELADIGPAAIEVQRQCRRADGFGDGLGHKHHFRLGPR